MFSVTEKVDGQSATYFLQKISRRKYEFGVCSRNIRLGAPDNSSYWAIARKYDIENVLKKLIGEYQTIVLQGEICGDGIQGNKYRSGNQGSPCSVRNQVCSHRGGGKGSAGDNR